MSCSIDALIHNGAAQAGAVTGTGMAWYAIFNGLSRIAWGSVSERIEGADRPKDLADSPRSP